MITVEVTKRGGEIVAAKIIADPYASGSAGYKTTYQNRNDWKTILHAENIARLLGPGYIATDAGPYVSPRYDVQKLPQVGDKVSYAFNGDYYPCGIIKTISAGPVFRRIVAEDEGGRKHVFWRRRASGSWVMRGTWSLVHGHVSKLNPEF